MDRPDTRTATPPGLWLKARLALLALGWEVLWPRLWPASGVLALFLALALFDVLPLLPGWLHALALAGFAAGLGLALRNGLRGSALPDLTAALHRLEIVNQLAHRPLRGCRDRLADGDDDPLSQALWQQHRSRQPTRFHRLRIGLPQSGLAERDPYTLRAAVGMLLFIAAAGTWGDWRPRLLAAFLPHFGTGTERANAALDLWLAPAEYTGVAPLLLQRPVAGTAPGVVTVPAGSAILARVSGGRGLPHLLLDQRDTAFEAVDEHHFQLRTTLTAAQSLSVTQDGSELARWPLAVVPDRLPAIRFASPPAAGDRGVLKLDFTAEDDYGLTAVAALIRPAEPERLAPGIERAAAEVPLSLPGGRPRQVHGSGSADLSASSWAGLPVRLQLVATDAAGQRGISEELTVTLPERRFHHPLAQRLIELRRRLVQQGPAARGPVAQALEALARHPEQYRDDIVVYLSLHSSAVRLVIDAAPETPAVVRALLWELAIRIEDGRLSLVERQLRDAQQALAEALQRGDGDAELGRLMDALEQAFVRYLDALEQQARQGALPPPGQSPPGSADSVDREELEAMLEQLRGLTETGNREAARQLLERMQQMLDSLQAGGMPQPGQQEQLEALRELQDITRDQRELLDRTFRQMQGPGGPGPLGGNAPTRRPVAPRPGAGQGASPAEQGELRRRLGETLGRLNGVLPELPRPLPQAERAMRDAETALRLGQPEDASAAQSQAVDNLQQGLRSLSERLMGQSGAGGGRDPLGRRLPGQGPLDTAGNRLPEAQELQRARRILEELRRRAGERERPRLELDYIDRLLRQF